MLIVEINRTSFFSEMPKRIIYIDIDSLRPDHLGCYGYHWNTSPNIDKVAAEGIRFENYYVTDAPCLPSRTAFFTGRYGINTGVVNHGGVYADPWIEGPDRGFRSSSTEHALAERLRQAGWYTTSISPFPHRHSAYQIWEGFHETYDTGHDGGETADQTWPYLERWLKEFGTKENVFLHFNVWDPHSPYRTPQEYGNPFENDPPPDWLTQEQIDRLRESYGPYDARCTNPHMRKHPEQWHYGTIEIKNRDDFKKWIDGYDIGVSYADHYVGRFIEGLRAIGAYEDSALIISADHGENHGELGVWGDHQTADHITSRVPLIIRWPGLTDDRPGKVYSGLHYNIDLSATLVDLAGGSIPEPWDGQTFADAIKGGEDNGREFLVVSQGCWACQRAVRWDDWILIRTYHTGFKDFPSVLLFNVAEDPHETKDLCGDKPEVVAEGLRRLESWITDNLRKSGREDPLMGVIAEGGPYHAKTANQHDLPARMRATGRGHLADWLEKNGGLPRDT